MEGSISFWGYKEQETHLILPEHDDDDDGSVYRNVTGISDSKVIIYIGNSGSNLERLHLDRFVGYKWFNKENRKRCESLHGIE
jgi:hypothetical protein